MHSTRLIVVSSEPIDTVQILLCAQVAVWPFFENLEALPLYNFCNAFDCQTGRDVIHASIYVPMETFMQDEASVTVGPATAALSQMTCSHCKLSLQMYNAALAVMQMETIIEDEASVTVGPSTAGLSQMTRADAFIHAQTILQDEALVTAASATSSIILMTRADMHSCRWGQLWRMRHQSQWGWPQLPRPR